MELKRFSTTSPRHFFHFYIKIWCQIECTILGLCSFSIFWVIDHFLFLQCLRFYTQIMKFLQVMHYFKKIASDLPFHLCLIIIYYFWPVIILNISDFSEPKLMYNFYILIIELRLHHERKEKKTVWLGEREWEEKN